MTTDTLDRTTTVGVDRLQPHFDASSTHTDHTLTGVDQLRPHLEFCSQYFTQLAHKLDLTLDLEFMGDSITDERRQELSSFISSAERTRPLSLMVDAAAVAIENKDPNKAISLTRAVILKVAEMIPELESAQLEPVMEQFAVLSQYYVDFRTQLERHEAILQDHERRLSALEAQFRALKGESIDVYLTERLQDPVFLNAVIRDTKQDSPSLSPDSPAFQQKVRSTFGNIKKVADKTRIGAQGYLAKSGYVRADDRQLVASAATTQKIPVVVPDTDSHAERKVA